MNKHPRTVTNYILANGTGYWVAEGASLFLPETDVEIGLRMFSIKDNDSEVLIFNPMSITLGAKTAIPENIPEEKEIPERDR